MKTKSPSVSSFLRINWEGGIIGHEMKLNARTRGKFYKPFFAAGLREFNWIVN